MSRDELRNIPSVTDLARILVRRELASTDERAVSLARHVQKRTRAALLNDPTVSLWPEIDRQLDRLEHLMTDGRFRPVINATGILIHTNLGRAAVSEATARAMAHAAASSVALEIEPSTGRRGGRMDEIATLLRLLTGAEAVLVVNNNAAAILLTLSGLTAGRNVAVSRAEAVEIGGGFRIPDVMAESGAHLIEVGTTNRTYADDFRRSGIGEGDAILKVHSSNFSINGFVTAPSLGEMRSVADACGALLIEDLGSGTLVDTGQFGIEHEPTIQESLEAGVDVVTFSGDKLLGGPQAGIIAGRKTLMDRIAKAPLARAVRADKTTLAGIAETLRHYARGDAMTEVPLYRMMHAAVETLQGRALSVAEQIGGGVSVVTTTNHIGGGALPSQALPGVALQVNPGGGSPDELSRSLRLDSETPIYGRIENGVLLMEMRTVMEEDDDALVATVRRVLGQ